MFKRIAWIFVFLAARISLYIYFYTVDSDLRIVGVSFSHIQLQSLALSALFFLRDAAIEELFFRLIPIVLAMKSTPKNLFLPLAIVLSSVIFGAAHGDSVVVYETLAGIMYSIIFIVTGSNKKEYLAAFCVVVACHFIFNMFMFCISFS